MPGTPQKETLIEPLSNQMERFCYALVNTGDKYKAFDIARYEGKNQGAKAAAVSRLLKRSNIKARIKVLEREYYEALGIDNKRILGNVAEIAFNKNINKQDRLRALELLGKERAMWKDNQVGISADSPKPLQAKDLDLLRTMAKALTESELAGPKTVKVKTG